VRGKKVTVPARKTCYFQIGSHLGAALRALLLVDPGYEAVNPARVVGIFRELFL
jgi:23S rRNA A2030 N6-methylase RlmJ